MSGWGSVYNNVAYALSLQMDQLARLQEQASTGSRVNRASDDPADAYAILRLQGKQNRAASDAKSLSAIETNLQMCDSALQDVSTALQQLQQLLSQAASGTYTIDQRASMAEEVDSLLERVLAQANTQGAAGYVFGGGRLGTAPYAAQRDANGRITSVLYQGSSSPMPVPVAEGVLQYGQLVGDSVFRADQRQAPVFLGSTGAAAGAGTSSVRGDVWLSVGHTATTYDAGSQLDAGSRSAAEDTVIGTHTVTISAAQKTIQLDGGIATAFAGGETNLCVQNASGDTIYVDMTGWTTADGTFNLSATGTLSLDDGTTPAALTGSENEAVTDPASGRVLYVDGRGIVRTGLEAVRVPGTHDAFGTLIHVRDTLANTGGLSSSQQLDLLDDALDSVREILGQVTRADTAIGGRLRAVDELRQSVSDAGALAAQQASSLQDADIADLSVELMRVQNLYQMTLASAAKLLNVSLLDYL